MEMELDPLSDPRCRVCLNITEHALYLEESISGSAEAVSYMDVLMLCCNIKKSLDDGKPKNICSACMKNARTSYEFRICCERSNAILENEIYATSRDNSDGDIKYGDSDDSVSADPSYNGIKYLILVSNKKHGAGLYENTMLDNNLDEVPIVKYVKEILPNLDGDTQKTVVCGDSCQSRQEYSKHLEKCNISEDTNEQDKMINSINKGFPSHVQDGHGIDVTVEGNDFRKSSGGIKKCGFCNFTTTGMFKLGKHMREEHNDKKTISCDKCNKTFFTRTRLLDHLSHQHRTNDKKFMCEVCGMQFTHAPKLKWHMFRHTGERPHKCMVCSKAFSRSASLTHHIKLVHSEESEDRNVKCDECGKCYKTKNALKQHYRFTHTQELNYKCIVCDKAFFDKRGLHEHSIVHTGLRLFKCEVCNKSFGRRCHIDRHMRTHTGEKPYLCQLCGIGFSQANCLWTHQLKKHPTIGIAKN